MTVHSYRYSSADAGRYRVFVAHGVWVVVLPAPTQPDLAEQLWALVEDPAVSVDDLERAVLSRGNAAPADWALVRWGSDSGAEIRLHGEERVDVWTERGWQRVSAPEGPVQTAAGVMVFGELDAVPGGAPRGAGVPFDGGIIVAQRLDGRFRVAPPQQDSDGVARHDGMTMLSPEVVNGGQTRPQVVVGQRVGFRVNGGRVHDLETTHYFGRNPRQPKIPLPDPARLVTLVSPAKLVSATHLEIKVIGGVVVATDLRSTNGSCVLEPGSSWRHLRGGEPEVLEIGSHIDLGDGNVIEIVRVPAPAAAPSKAARDPREAGSEPQVAAAE